MNSTLADRFSTVWYNENASLRLGSNDGSLLSSRFFAFMLRVYTSSFAFSVWLAAISTAK